MSFVCIRCLVSCIPQLSTSPAAELGPPVPVMGMRQLHHHWDLQPLVLGAAGSSPAGR